MNDPHAAYVRLPKFPLACLGCSNCNWRLQSCNTAPKTACHAGGRGGGRLIVSRVWLGQGPRRLLAESLGNDWCLGSFA